MKHRVRVRYAETDQMGVVHHSVYPLYLEEARSVCMEAAGAPYDEMEKRGLHAPLVSLQLRFRKPARYGEFVTVDTVVSRVGGSSIEYTYAVTNDAGELLCEGSTLHALTKSDLSLVRVPDWLREALGAIQ